MKDIEIQNNASGVPQVVLHADVKSEASEAQKRGVEKILISLSRFYLYSSYPGLTI